MEMVNFTNQVRARLVAHRGRFKEIADGAGVSYSWISKFAAGRFQNPGVKNIDALRAALDRIESA